MTFLRDHSIHDIPYLEWVRLTDSERTELVPDWHTKDVTMAVKKLPPVDQEVQNVAVARTTRATSILAWAESVEVTVQNLAVVSSALTDIKAEASRVDIELKKITKPMNDALKATRAFFAPATSAYAKSESILKTKISVAQGAQLVLNQQAAVAAQAALARGDARGAALAAHALEDTSLPSNITVSDRWEFVIENPDLVPRELCSPDEAKVRAYVKAWGDRAQIPGVRISKGATVTVRQP